MQVSDLVGVVSEIVRTSREQATSLKEVVAAGDLMDKVTQQNAAMLEETRPAARSLPHETGNLAWQEQRFRTGSAATVGDMAEAMRRIAEYWTECAGLTVHAVLGTTSSGYQGAALATECEYAGLVPATRQNPPRNDGGVC